MGGSGFQDMTFSIRIVENTPNLQLYQTKVKIKYENFDFFNVVLHIVEILGDQVDLIKS